jgi:hypothetical protein
MKLSRLHISVFLGLSILAWSIVLLCQGTEFTRDQLRPFGTVVGALVALSLLLEHVLWRVKYLHPWFVSRPDLRGTWRVTLQSDYVDPETGTQILPIACFMGIKQTLSTLRMHLMTPESESWLIAESIIPSPNGDGYQIVGVYTNKPKIHLRGKKSDIHLGALVLDTHGATYRPTSVTGEFWTDRSTAGSMDFVERHPRVFTRYNDAQATFGEQTTAETDLKDA